MDKIKEEYCIICNRIKKLCSFCEERTARAWIKKYPFTAESVVNEEIELQSQSEKKVI